MKSTKILFFLSLSFACQFFIKAEQDYIPFLNFALLKEFNQNFLLKIDGEYDRYADSKTNYIHNEIGFIYKINPKHISSDISYRFIKTKNSTSNDIQQRIYFDLCFRDIKDKFHLSDKLGFEFRAHQRNQNILFLKNKIRVAYEIESSKNSFVRPYIADTIYYDINKHYSHMNRLYFGILSNHHKWLFIDFQYYLESYFKRFTISSKYSHNLGIQFTFFIPEKNNHKNVTPFYDLKK